MLKSTGTAAMTYGSPPVARPPYAPPSLVGLLGEWRAGVEVGRALLAAPELNAQPRGEGPVMLIPGWQAPELSMRPMQGYLRWLGYDARGWGLGVNTGDPERDRDVLVPKVRAWAEEAGRPVTLIGWSLGGVIARELARVLPDHVDQVITYGSPIVGGPRYTLGAYTLDEATAAHFEARQALLDQGGPLRLPITVIFSRQDRIVAWEACIDRVSPNAVHVEVDSTHIGMSYDPDVWRVVAQRLAARQPRGMLAGGPLLSGA